MGIEYDGVGGIGVLVSDEMMAKLIEANKFTEEEWRDDPDECLEGLGLHYAQAGDAYSGDTCWYLLIAGKNLGEILANEASFIEKLASFDISITRADLKVVSDLYIY